MPSLSGCEVGVLRTSANDDEASSLVSRPMNPKNPVHPLNAYIMGTIGLKARVLKSSKMGETVSNCFSVYNRSERPIAPEMSKHPLHPF